MVESGSLRVKDEDIDGPVTVDLLDGDEDVDTDVNVDLLDENVEVGKVEVVQTRFSKKALLVLYVVVCFDVAVIMIVIPFLPAFFKERIGVTDPKLGLAVGSVTSAYYLGNTLSSAYMGYLSDVYGRRPILFFGLFTSLVTVFTFPLGTTVWMVILNRFICGLLNTNITITRTCLADISRDWGSARRTTAFGYLGAVWGLSRFFSSAIAGLTIGIMVPFLPFAKDNRFFFPCFSISIALLFVTLFAFRYLPETRPEVANDTGKSSRHAGEVGSSFWSKLGHLYRQGGPVLIRLLLVHMLHHFLNGGVLTIMVLFWALEITKGGFGLDANAIGVTFGFFGLTGLVFQLSLFSTLTKALGARKMYNLGALFLSSGVLAIWGGALPLKYITSSGGKLVWILISSLPMSFGFMCGLPVLTGLLANAAPPEIMGLTQGVAQSTGAMSRMVGPLVCGALFSYSIVHNMSYISFVLVGSLYFVNFLATLGLPESIESVGQEIQTLEPSSGYSFLMADTA